MLGVGCVEADDGGITGGGMVQPHPSASVPANTPWNGQHHLAFVPFPSLCHAPTPSADLSIWHLGQMTDAATVNVANATIANAIVIIYGE